jgi:hypothetical protein
VGVSVIQVLNTVAQICNVRALCPTGECGVSSSSEKVSCSLERLSSLPEAEKEGLETVAEGSGVQGARKTEAFALRLPEYGQSGLGRRLFSQAV